MFKKLLVNDAWFYRLFYSIGLLITIIALFLFPTINTQTNPIEKLQIMVILGLGPGFIILTLFGHISAINRHKK